jgi:hypothetical protein
MEQLMMKAFVMGCAVLKCIFGMQAYLHDAWLMPWRGRHNQTYHLHLQSIDKRQALKKPSARQLSQACPRATLVTPWKMTIRVSACHASAEQLQWFEHTRSISSTLGEHNIGSMVLDSMLTCIYTFL